MISNLTGRDRWLVIGGVGVVLVYVIYAWIYSPLEHSIQKKSKQLQQLHFTVNLMNEAHRTLKDQARYRPAITDKTERYRVVGSYLKNVPSTYHIALDSQGDMFITYEEVPFKKLLRQLYAMCDQNAVLVRKFDIVSKGVSGKVAATIQLHFPPRA